MAPQAQPNLHHRVSLNKEKYTGMGSETGEIGNCWVGTGWHFHDAAIGEQQRGGRFCACFTTRPPARYFCRLPHKWWLQSGCM